MTNTADHRAVAREEVIARNLEAVETHFFNETPENVDKALAVYADDVVWEAPARGQIHRNIEDIKNAYLDIFASFQFESSIRLRRFATETSVFDDRVDTVVVVGTKIPNMDYPVGTRLSIRLLHCFELNASSEITREIGYEIYREAGTPKDRDDIPQDADHAGRHS